MTTIITIALIGLIIISIFYCNSKFSCKHKWKTKATKSYRESKVGYAAFKDVTYEILICEKCGKIENIEY